MPLRFHAYIDEAGDEGLGKLKEKSHGQSHWFLIGGIIVSATDEAKLTGFRDGILNLFPRRRKRDLHFRDLNHGQRVAACHQFAKLPFKVVTVCSNKITLVGDPKYYALFKKKDHLYNYLTRYWLERVTKRCADIGRRMGRRVELHVCFSRRASTDYHAMREYFELQRGGSEIIRPARNISWSVFDPANIRVENHSRSAGLQLADLATSATASALEPNGYGHREPRYSQIIRHQYLADNGHILDCGLTMIPGIENPQTPKEVREFAKEMQEKWQAPGP